MLPNVMIAGVNKAGTTSLFSYLGGHPDVCVSDVKETGFFLSWRYEESPLPDVAAYERYFRGCGGERYCLEATPGYFYGGEKVARAILEQVGRIKILLVLREPVARAFSFYQSQKKLLRLPPEMRFEEYIAVCEGVSAEQIWRREWNVYWGVAGGYYGRYLPAWWEVFGAEQVKVLFFEHLRDDPGGVLEDVCRWLQIEGAYFEGMQWTVENRSVGYRWARGQRLALAVNRGLERFWRRYPTVKRRLRGWYWAVNGQAFGEVLGDKERMYLEGKYRASNTTVATLLRGQGMVDLPAWLRLS